MNATADDLRRKLREAIPHRGVRRAASEMSVPYMTLVNILAGAEPKFGTAQRILAWLEQQEAGQPPAAGTSAPSPQPFDSRSRQATDRDMSHNVAPAGVQNVAGSAETPGGSIGDPETGNAVSEQKQAFFHLAMQMYADLREAEFEAAHDAIFDIYARIRNARLGAREPASSDDGGQQ